jgi:hypothetical protein
MLGTASKLVATRAKEPNEDELSRAEYNAACNEEQKLAKSFENHTEVLIEVFARLHLCTFKTPTCRRFMSAKVGSLCAFHNL